MTETAPDPKRLARRQRRRAIQRIAAALCVCTVALYTAGWFYEAHRVRAWLGEQISSAASRGIQIRADSLSVSGFPFRLAVEASHVVALRGDGAQARLTIPDLSVAAYPWNFFVWRFTAPQGASGGVGPAALAVARLDGTLEPAADGALALTIDGQNASCVRDRRVWSAQTVAIALSLPPGGAVGQDQTSLGFDADLRKISLPEASPLGDIVTDLAFAGGVQGQIPPPPWLEALRFWRDIGGTVEIRKLHLAWGGVLGDASGTLALDQAMQPLGAFSAEISGYGAILDALVEVGQIKPDAARYMRIGLDLLAQSDANGNKVLKAPVTIQNGGLFMGPARIAKIPKVSW
jgi:hypothetical protein